MAIAKLTTNVERIGNPRNFYDTSPTICNLTLPPITMKLGKVDSFMDGVKNVLAESARKREAAFTPTAWEPSFVLFWGTRS